jgi:hypothetical protein
MPPIFVKDVRYTVLRLSGEHGNIAYLLRSETGEFFGVTVATRRKRYRQHRSS